MGAVSINEEKVIALVIVGEEGKLSIFVHPRRSPEAARLPSHSIRFSLLLFVFQFLSRVLSRAKSKRPSERREKFAETIDNKSREEEHLRVSARRISICPRKNRIILVGAGLPDRNYRDEIPKRDRPSHVRAVSDAGKTNYATIAPPLSLSLSLSLYPRGTPANERVPTLFFEPTF